jgi:hypothetical protein
LKGVVKIRLQKRVLQKLFWVRFFLASAVYVNRVEFLDEVCLEEDCFQKHVSEGVMPFVFNLDSEFRSKFSISGFQKLVFVQKLVLVQKRFWFRSLKLPHMFSDGLGLLNISGFNLGFFFISFPFFFF